MTSRELADAIDRLICLRRAEGQLTNEDAVRVAGEKIELEKRAIADAFKRLDHTGGMYVVGKDACGKEQA